MLEIISDKVKQLCNLLVYDNAKIGQKSKSRESFWKIFSGGRTILIRTIHYSKKFQIAVLKT